MQIKLLKEAFLSMCLENRLKKNHEQITIIEKLTKFYEQINEKNSFIKNIFYKRKKKGRQRGERNLMGDLSPPQYGRGVKGVGETDVMGSKPA